MTKKRFLTYWYTGMGIATAVVAIVAALVLTIIATAQSILSLAKHALNAANEIVTTTRPIWQLEHTNEAAAQLLTAAQAIERHATQVADTLEKPRTAQ
ncbi:MAG: hypothetical protein ACJ797_22775 [Ktedonobacteraceae bacterium]